MRLNIAILDDERSQTEKISTVVRDWSEREGHRCELRTFFSAEEFLFEYESDSSYDILLLDVEMGEISGISLAKRIRKENNRAEIIFITSHFEFAGEGYEVDALHYLVKPISEAKLCEVLSKAAEKLSVEPPSVVITCGGETVKLYESEILYTESFLHYIVIHTREKEYKLKESISFFEEKLSEDFFRAHRSYLVSLKHIVRISRTCVLLDDRTEIPLARGKYNDINRAFIARN
ncbi:MAG: response regulator transcription factor [Clostridia bacterium]|nr:response regulator transcription factor [Clostridia bacterium]